MKALLILCCLLALGFAAGLWYARQPEPVAAESAVVASPADEQPSRASRAEVVRAGSEQMAQMQARAAQLQATEVDPLKGDGARTEAYLALLEKRAHERGRVLPEDLIAADNAIANLVPSMGAEAARSLQMQFHQRMQQVAAPSPKQRPNPTNRDDLLDVIEGASDEARDKAIADYLEAVSDLPPDAQRAALVELDVARSHGQGSAQPSEAVGLIQEHQ